MTALKDCQHFSSGECRSCGLLNLSYAKQLKVKQEQTLQALAPFINNDTEIESICGAEPAMASRLKTKLAVSGTVENPILGYPQSSGEVIDIKHCPIVDIELNRLATQLRELITAEKLEPYQIHSRSGELKYIILKKSYFYPQVMLRFVLRSKELVRRIRDILPELRNLMRDRGREIQTISVNIQPLPAAIVEGSEEIMLTEEVYLEDRLAQTELLFSPQSFSQVTPQIAEKLYLKASQKLRAVNSSSVLDLFCGVGAFGLVALRHNPQLKQVTAVESTATAVMAANLAANKNALTNYRAEQIVVEDFAELKSHRHHDTLIVNPPRKGLGEKIAQFVIGQKPKHLLYSSCSLSTLAKDLACLSPEYKLNSVAVFDMFPMTEHFEVLVQLEH
ncbi:methyltransferase domain-containing protein [bacterium]|nr:methyltransferase domain-containing protein [bacterium]